MMGLGDCNSVGHHPPHSFPGEGLFMGVSHPKFMCNPIFTDCIWASCTRGDWGGDKGSFRGRKETLRCFGAGLLSYILSHGKTRQQEVPLSSLRQPGRGWGAPAHACGPQAWPCTTLETTEMEACRAGSEEITLDAIQCLKMAQPVPGVLWNCRAGRAGAIPGLGGE